MLSSVFASFRVRHFKMLTKTCFSRCCCCTIPFKNDWYFFHSFIQKPDKTCQKWTLGACLGVTRFLLFTVMINLCIILNIISFTCWKATIMFWFIPRCQCPRITFRTLYILLHQIQNLQLFSNLEIRHAWTNYFFFANGRHGTSTVLCIKSFALFVHIILSHYYMHFKAF